MVALTYCAGCTTGHHEGHVYWIQRPPEGVMGGFACKCSGPDECAGNGEKLLRSLFGDQAPVEPARPVGGDTREAELREAIACWLWRKTWTPLGGTGRVTWDQMQNQEAWREEADELLALDAVRAALAAQETVRRLHRRTDGGWCQHCGDISDGGHGIWPCDTIRALEGETK